MANSINLSDGEWKLMNLLWEESPRTVSQMTEELREDTGWDKATVLVMLRRMEKKGAVRVEQPGRCKQYYPCVEREGAAAAETVDFLHRVYGGSIGLLVSSMATQRALSKKEIDELYEILEKAEREAEK
jgi:BlaI family penicillinase repressor